MRRLRAVLPLSALLLSGWAPVVSLASLPACPAFTDPSGDAYAVDGHRPGTTAQAEPGLDIVKVGMHSGPDTVRVIVTVANLDAGPAVGEGDGFSVAYRSGPSQDSPTLTLQARRSNPAAVDDALDQVAGTGVQLTSHRAEAYYPDFTADPVEIDVAYDTGAETITFTVPAGTLRTLLGVTRLDGVTWRGALAASGPAVARYDAGWTDVATTSGTTPSGECDPSAWRLVTADPISRLPGANPGLPRAGCRDREDPAGDATYLGDSPLPSSGPDDEPNVDITSLTVGTRNGSLAAVVGFAGLGETTTAGLGPRVAVTFRYAGQQVSFVNAKPSSVFTTVSTQAFPQLTYAPSADGATEPRPDAPLQSSWDTGTDTVSFWISLHYLETLLGAALPDGSSFEEMTAESAALALSATRYDDPRTRIGVHGGDYQLDELDEPLSYRVGTGPCYPPPPSRLTGLTGLAAQYGDPGTVAVRLATEEGVALGGRPVVFDLAGAVQTVSTDTTGLARFGVRPGRTAGGYPLRISFAGDSAAQPVQATATFVVRAETTRFLPLRVARRGATRTLAAVLVDDDGKPVPGVVVGWYVNGRKVAALRTDAKGVTSYGKAKAGQTVLVHFAGVTGRYAGARLSLRLT